jgi:osmotically inducible lipoprotein OsmB
MISSNRSTRRLAFMSACAIALGGCGSMPEERALSGAGIGAGAGAALGAVTGMSVMTGALIGTAAGALTGVLTDQSQVNLGQPAWQQGSASATAAAPAANPAGAARPSAMNNTTVVAIQQQLNRLGYDAGTPDGLIGPRTTSAIKQYQRDHNLLIDGRATPELAGHIQSLGRPLAQNPG